MGNRIQWKIRTVVLVSLCLALGLVLTSCNPKSHDTSKSGKPTTKADQQHKHNKYEDLKPYSKDKDKNDPSEGDFDVIGQYVTETHKEIVLKIKDKNIAIKKKSSFHEKKQKLKKGLKGKQVVVEVSNRGQTAENLKPTPKAVVNQEGIYENQDGKGYKMLALLAEDSKTTITVKTPKGRKTYQKSKDFKMNTDAQGTKLKGKMVRLQISKQGKAESLHYNWMDQE